MARLLFDWVGSRVNVCLLYFPLFPDVYPLPGEIDKHQLSFVLSESAPMKRSVNCGRLFVDVI